MLQLSLFVINFPQTVVSWNPPLALLRPSKLQAILPLDQSGGSCWLHSILKYVRFYQIQFFRENDPARWKYPLNTMSRQERFSRLTQRGSHALLPASNIDGEVWELTFSFAQIPSTLSLFPSRGLKFYSHLFSCLCFPWLTSEVVSGWISYTIK